MVFVIKPSFVSHTDDKGRPTSIFSCDVSPDGQRLATASLDQKIKIWNTKPILDEDSENDESQKKLLSTLSSHTGVVLCVRWSPDGRYLASGSDDQIVIIWERDEFATGGKVFGQTEENHEKWIASRRLVGHSNDVGAIAWSQDGYYMATGGVDGHIVVYDAETFQTIKKIQFHEGMIKGLAFDPAGEFLASQSDDRSACIWKTSDWSLAKQIQEVFTDSPNTSFFRRLNWSPEGTFLALPNTVNNGVFVATITRRNEWGIGTSLLGHENVADVAMFSPRSFVKDPAKPATGNNLSAVVAIAARSTVSIWLTSQIRPIVVFDKIVDRDVMDLSWSKDGSTLYACSSDGHLAVIQFDVSELGNVAPPDAGRAFLQSWHTQRTPRFHSNHEGQTAGTVGAPNMLVARKGGKARSGLTRESSALLPIPPPGAPQDISIVNGRRRIKPAFLGLGSIVPQPSMTTSVMTSTPYARQNRPVPSLEANNQQPSTSRNAAVFQPQPQNLAQADIDMLDARMQQAPGRGSPHVNFFRTPLQDIGVPSWGTPQDRPVLAGQQASRKRRAAEMDYADENEPLPGLGPYRPSGRTLGGDRNIEPYTGEVVELQPAYIPKTRINTINENLALAVPAVMAYQSKKWDAATDEAEKLEYRNYASHTKPSEVALMDESGKVQWLDYLPSAIVIAAFTPSFAAISCTDKTLHIYSPTGRRLLPILIMDAPCSFLDASAQYLLAITARGSLSVWDIRQRKATIKSTNITGLLMPTTEASLLAPVIAAAKVRPNGWPVISLTNGQTLTFDAELDSWTQISSIWWAKGSDCWESAGRVRGSTLNAGRGAVKLLEAETNDWLQAQSGKKAASVINQANSHPTTSHDTVDVDVVAASETEVIQGEEKTQLGDDDDWKTALTLGHLEARMHAAIVLDSLMEYKSFLGQYAKKLAEEAFRGKAEELCKELLGPVYLKTNRADPWDSHILGTHKHVFLKDVLSIFSKTKNLSRLATETSDLLKRIQSD